MQTIWSDVRYAGRAIWVTRGSAFGTAVVLAIGIGLSATIFALADPFLWRSLPYSNPQELVVVRVDGGNLKPGTELVEAPTLELWRSYTSVVQDVAAYGSLRRIRVSTPAGAVVLPARPVSANFLRVLGMSDVTAVPSTSANLSRVVINHSSMPRAFSESREQEPWITEDGVLEVVGGTPTRFVFPDPNVRGRPALLTLTDLNAIAWRGGGIGVGSVNVIARLQPGTTIDALRSALQPSADRAGLRLQFNSIDNHLAGGMRRVALAGVGASILVTLLCAANVLALLAIRIASRSRDFAVRLALGGSRLALFRLVWLEVVLLAALATVGGLVLTASSLWWITSVAPDAYLALGHPSVTTRVSAFAIGAGLFVAMAGGIQGWLVAMAVAPGGLRRANSTDSLSLRQWRYVLTAAQATIATVFLVCAAFLLRSYTNLWSRDIGYAMEPRAVSVSYHASRTPEQLLQTVQITVEALGRIPGVIGVAAGATVGAILDGYDGGGGNRVQGGGNQVLLQPSQVTPEYFDVTGMRLLAGRGLKRSDTGWSAVVVNSVLAQRLWPGLPMTSIVGQPVVGNGSPGTVVGIVQGTVDRSLDGPVPPRLYKPMASVHLNRVSYLLKGVNPTESDSAIRRTVIASDSQAVIEAVGSISERLADTISERSFRTSIVVLFAIAGSGVSAAGILVLMAFAVARRTKEIAIRMALGARPMDVARTVVRGAAMAVAAGSCLGLIVGLLIVQALRSQLYGVEPGDPATIGIATGMVLLIAIAAAWWPVRRAVALDPVAALRN